jgi:DNA helicase-2/ATP-dependent DNA helicase PcrA
VDVDGQAAVGPLNSQSHPLEEALREVGVPHFVHGGQAFFDRSEVRDLLAYLKVCASPADEVSLARIVNVPARGIGDASLSRLHDWAVEQGIRLLEALPAGALVVLDPAAADRPADIALRSAEVLAGLRSILAGLKPRISP